MKNLEHCRGGMCRLLVLGLVVIFAIFTGCREVSVSQHQSSDLASAVRVVNEMTIFFGHQSVGANVLEGLMEVEDLVVPIIDVVNDATDTPASGGAVLHAYIGRNLHPSEKISHFADLMRTGIGSRADVALMKFCYVDTGGNTTIGHLFSSYVDEMERLETEYPDTIMVYLTIPLTSSRGGIKDLVKRLLGMGTTGREGNVERNRFNTMLRQAKGATGRLFDIAAIEATRSDGTPETFRLNGETFSAMVPEYTNDGGHLTELGRRIVAEELVRFLANLR